MPCCAVFGCNNTNQKNAKIPPSERVSFHSFSTAEPFLSKWINFCGRKDPINVKNARICSIHFTQDDRLNDLKNRLLGVPMHLRKLKPDAVPSQNGPKPPKLTPTLRKAAEERSQRSTKRANHRLVLELLGPSPVVNKKLICSAPHCINSQECGYRLFKFPKERKRRKLWLENCSVGQCSLDPPLSLCEVHFENDQFEFRKNRKDKCLKADAIPTIFDVISQKELSEEISQDPRSTTRMYSPIDLDSSEGSPHANSAHSDSPTPALEKRSTAELLEEIVHLKYQLKKMEQMLKTFLTDEQIQALANAHQGDEKEKSSAWNPESITQGLKFQFNLGTHGYNFLRSTNYPLPTIETLNTRLGNTVISFGVFEDLSELVQYKVQALDPLDRLCTISLNEMQFGDSKDLVKHKRHLITGSSRDHDTETDGNCITVVLIRGLRSSWEQVIACDTTAHATEGMSQRTLLEKSISFAEECGLRVLSFSSNLSTRSRLMWSAFGVDLTNSETERITHFNFNDHEIHVIPDVCHLLKSLKAAVDRGVHLSQSMVDSEALPSTHVSSKYVKELWDCEIKKQPASKLLNHLQEQYVEPGVNDQISLEAAVQFFSVKTARALESAVMSKTVNPDALSTAYFCRLVDQWFSICDSKAPEDGITIDNKQTVFEFLRRFINIFQGIKIDDGWSPINAQIIMSTLSLCEVVDILLQQEGFGAVLLHRFSQDAVEDVISQMSELPGSTPTAFSVQCLETLKTITISQLISDVDRSCYLIPSMTSWVEKCVKTSSTPVTTECKPRKRIRKDSKTTSRMPKCELQKPKRRNIKKL